MKKLSILLFMLLSLCLQAQHDTIKSRIKINNTVELGFSTAQVTAALGPPSRISDFYNEMKVKWVAYNYKGNYLYFDNDVLVAFELKNKLLFLNEKKLSVGRDIRDITFFERLYPGAYVEMGGEGNPRSIMINIPAGISGKPEFIIINFDTKSNNILFIGTGQYTFD